MLAETAELAVLLRLKDEMTGGIARAEKELSGLNKTATTANTRSSGLSGAFGSASKAAHGFGGALSHAGGQLKGLASGPLGLLGVTGGLLTLGGAIEQGIGKAQELGKTVIRLSAVTGLDTETTSALSVAMEHFNVTADSQIRLFGFLEKNVGLLAARKDGIVKFQQDFGVALTDANGKIKNANDLILTLSDYWNNKGIPATQKAAGMSKLLGRSWQELIPFLSAGRAGIAAAEAEAAKFGLTLSRDDIAALKEAKTASRDWNTALAGLETRIGITLLPSLSALAKTATAFVAQNRDQIVGFFREGSKWASTFGQAIKDYVIPTFGLIKSGWDAIPEPIRQVILAGVIGGKISKFLFNFGPIDIAKTLGGGLFGQFLARGSPVNPMWVKQIGLPGIPGPTGGIPAPGGLSTLGKLFLVGEAIGLVAAVEGVREAVGAGNSRVAAQVSDQTKQWLAQTPSAADLQNGLAAVDKGISDIRSNPLNVLIQGDALDKLTQMRADIARQLALTHTPDQASTAAREFDAGANQQFNDQSPAMIRAFNQSLAPKLAALRAPLDVLHQDFAAQLNLLRKTADPQAAARAADKIAAAVLKGVGSAQGTKAIIAELQKKRQIALDAHDHSALVAIDAAIKKVESKLPNRTWVDRELALGAKIAASGERQDRKISDLTAIQRVLRDRGDTHAAGLIRQKIEELKNRLARTTTDAGRLTAAAIAHKKSLVQVNVANTVNVATTVSSRQLRTAEVTVSRYGRLGVGWIG